MARRTRGEGWKEMGLTTANLADSEGPGSPPERGKGPKAMLRE